MGRGTYIKDHFFRMSSHDVTAKVAVLSRGPPARIPRGTPRRDMQLFEYRSVRYWSKEINGALTGGRKKYFF